MWNAGVNVDIRRAAMLCCWDGKEFRKVPSFLWRARRPTRSRGREIRFRESSLRGVEGTVIGYLASCHPRSALSDSVLVRATSAAVQLRVRLCTSPTRFT